MIESVIMLAGVLAGYCLLKMPGRIKNAVIGCNNKIQIICVAAIIFIMGVNLGSIDDFAAKMMSMGWRSLIFAVVPTGFSVAAVYFFSKMFIKGV